MTLRKQLFVSMLIWALACITAGWSVGYRMGQESVKVQESPSSWLQSLPAPSAPTPAPASSPRSQLLTSVLAGDVFGPLAGSRVTYVVQPEWTSYDQIIRDSGKDGEPHEGQLAYLSMQEGTYITLRYTKRGWVEVSRY